MCRLKSPFKDVKDAPFIKSENIRRTLICCCKRDFSLDARQTIFYHPVINRNNKTKGKPYNFLTPAESNTIGN